MRPSLFWEVTQRRLVVRYRRFGTAYRSHVLPSSPSTFGILRPPLTHGLASRSLWTIDNPCHSLYNCVPKCCGHSSWTAWPLKVGSLGSPETSVTNHQYNLLNIPEQRRSHSKKTVGPLIIGPIFCVETSNYQCTVRNISEESSSQSRKALDNGANRLSRNVG